MRAVGLWVQLPHKGPSRPDGAHQRILASHQVEVCTPQQVVEFRLAQPGQVDASHPVGQRQAVNLFLRGSWCQRDEGGLVAQHLQQGRQGGVGVAEQHDQTLASLECQPARVQPRRSIKRRPTIDQACFAQQTSGRLGEAGVEEPLRQSGTRPAGLGRRQAMTALHPRLGAEVLQIDPDRRRKTLRHAPHEVRRRVAAKGLDDHVAWDGRCGCLVPGDHLHARHASMHGLRGQPRQRGEVIAPKPHLLTPGRQVGRQAPAHAHVAVVVDDLAEDVPVQSSRHQLIISSARIR